MSKNERFEGKIGQKTRQFAEWMLSEGFREGDPGAKEAALGTAGNYIKRQESEKKKRVMSYNRPTENYPFVGCSEVCSIPGVRGGVRGSFDHCVVVECPAGEHLYFCASPTANKLPDGTLPLCLNFFQAYKNEAGLRAVKSGDFRQKS